MAKVNAGDIEQLKAKQAKAQMDALRTWIDNHTTPANLGEAQSDIDRIVQGIDVLERIVRYLAKQHVK